MRHRVRLGADEETVLGQTNPLPTWFRLDRDNISHLERFIYDARGNEREGKHIDFADASKWIEESLCGPSRKGTGVKCLCEDRGSMTLSDYITRFKLGDHGELNFVILYLLHEVKMDMIRHMIDYLLEKRIESDLKDWFILVGYFFDRVKKLNAYSSSSLEMQMPDNLFNLLLKEEAEREPLVR